MTKPRLFINGYGVADVDGTINNVDIASTSVPSDSNNYTVVKQYQFAKGTYIVCVNGLFATTSATGVRALAYQEQNGSPVPVVGIPGVNGAWDRVNMVFTLKLTETKTIEILAMQTSGSSVNVAGTMSIARLC